MPIFPLLFSILLLYVTVINNSGDKISVHSEKNSSKVIGVGAMSLISEQYHLVNNQEFRRLNRTYFIFGGGEMTKENGIAQSIITKKDQDDCWLFDYPYDFSEISDKNKLCGWLFIALSWKVTFPEKDPWVLCCATYLMQLSLMV